MSTSTLPNRSISLDALAETPSSENLDALHDLASAVAPDSLPALTRWLSTRREAAESVDRTLAELGIPEPDYDSDGVAVPGSVIRKVLHYAAIDTVVESLRTLAAAPAARAA